MSRVRLTVRALMLLQGGAFIVWFVGLLAFIVAMCMGAFVVGLTLFGASGVFAIAVIAELDRLMHERYAREQRPSLESFLR